MRKCAVTKRVIIHTYNPGVPGYEISIYKPKKLPGEDWLPSIYLYNIPNQHFQLCLPSDTSEKELKTIGARKKGLFISKHPVLENKSPQATEVPSESDIPAYARKAFTDPKVADLDLASLSEISMFMSEVLEENKPGHELSLGEQQSRASKLQVLIGDFVRCNSHCIPHDVMSLFDFVNMLIGGTAQGKDKTGATIMNRNIANCGSGVNTRCPERISQLYDNHVDKLVVEVTDLDRNTQKFSSLEEANLHRKALHDALSSVGFRREYMNVLIREPSKNACNLTFLNFPGFVAEKPNRQLLLDIANAALNDMASRTASCILSASATAALRTNCGLNFRSSKSTKPNLKRIQMPSCLWKSFLSLLVATIWIPRLTCRLTKNLWRNTFPMSGSASLVRSVSLLPTGPETRE